MPFAIEVNDETAEKCRDLNERAFTALLSGDLDTHKALTAELAEIGAGFARLIAIGAQGSAENAGKAAPIDRAVCMEALEQRLGKSH